MKNILITLLALIFAVSCQQKDVPEETAKDTNQSEVVKEVLTKGCTKDLKVCPDGNSVVRNPENNCEFNPCPTNKAKDEPLARKKAKKEGVMCTADAKECADGSFVGRDHYNNCKFKACPNGEVTKEKI